MYNNGNFIRIALAEDVCGFDISTGHPNGSWGAETCIFKRDPRKPAWVCRSLANSVVESYETYEEAARGHEHYVKLIMSGKGEELLDARG